MSQEQQSKLSVFLPVNSKFGIAKGSGIVLCSSISNDLHRLYYEGNVHGASNLVTWGDRVVMAADRGVNRYPTTAMIFISSKDLACDFVEIGYLDTDTGSVLVDPKYRTLLDSYVDDTLGERVFSLGVDTLKLYNVSLITNGVEPEDDQARLLETKQDDLVISAYSDSQAVQIAWNKNGQEVVKKGVTLRISRPDFFYEVPSPVAGRV